MFFLVQRLNDILVGAALMGLVVLGVLEEHLVHVGAGILEQFVGGVEDDECDLTVTQDAQLISLLHQTELPLGESYLSVSFVSDTGDLYFFASHGFGVVVCLSALQRDWFSAATACYQRMERSGRAL